MRERHRKGEEGGREVYKQNLGGMTAIPRLLGTV